MGLTKKSTSSAVLREALLEGFQQRLRAVRQLEETHDDGTVETADGGLSRSSGSDENVSPDDAADAGIDEADFENDECLGCAFLHYFMLEELPTAIEKSRSDENAESIDNALQFIKDSHEKFMLYQGHVVRAWNQSKALEKMERKLFDDCLCEKILRRHAYGPLLITR